MAEATQTPRLRLTDLHSPHAGPFSFSLAAGACLAITGASGSGKSLLLRMIADLDPNSGDIWLDGRARATIPAPAWRRQVTYAAAESGWWSETVRDHFPDLPAARALAAALDLKPELLEGQVLRLSTGEKQRLALVRALLPNAPVLLLDEPTGPLDEASVARVEALLRARLASGTAIILVTHDPAQAGRLGSGRLGACHRVMRSGVLGAP